MLCPGPGLPAVRGVRVQRGGAPLQERAPRQDRLPRHEVIIISDI